MKNAGEGGLKKNMAYLGHSLQYSQAKPYIDGKLDLWYFPIMAP